MGYAGHAACMGEMRNAYNIMVKNLKEEITCKTYA
jgi:hypothetical protein